MDPEIIEKWSQKIMWGSAIVMSYIIAFGFGILTRLEGAETLPHTLNVNSPYLDLFTYLSIVVFSIAAFSFSAWIASILVSKYGNKDGSTDVALFMISLGIFMILLGLLLWVISGGL